MQEKRVILVSIRKCFGIQRNLSHNHQLYFNLRVGDVGGVRHLLKVSLQNEPHGVFSGQKSRDSKPQVI